MPTPRKPPKRKVIVDPPDYRSPKRKVIVDPPGYRGRRPPCQWVLVRKPDGSIHWECV